MVELLFNPTCNIVGLVPCRTERRWCYYTTARQTRHIPNTGLMLVQCLRR